MVLPNQVGHVMVQAASALPGPDASCYATLLPFALHRIP
jgi:hypothetical protein